ncbi:MAG: hypothetical protein M3O84_08870 [Actinomycetota bacterium]|nr:hypothetical protein [Actinomycetota bacterium]
MSRTRLAEVFCGLGLVVLLASPLAMQATPAAALPGRPNCTIRGTPGPDRLVGTTGDDEICGRGGNDRISGLAGDDSISGAGGNDVLRGGPGDDDLVGGSGNDSALGGQGADRIYGGPGADTCLSSFDEVTGNDQIVGGPGGDAFVADGGDHVRSANSSRPCTVRARLLGRRKGPSARLNVMETAKDGAPESWCWQDSNRSSYCADTVIDFSHLPSFAVPQQAVLVLHGNADTAEARIWKPNGHSYPKNAVRKLDLKDGAAALSVPPGRWFLELTGHWARGSAGYWFELDVRN